MASALSLLKRRSGNTLGQEPPCLCRPDRSLGNLADLCHLWQTLFSSTTLDFANYRSQPLAIGQPSPLLPVELLHRFQRVRF